MENSALMRKTFNLLTSEIGGRLYSDYIRFFRHVFAWTLLMAKRPGKILHPHTFAVKEGDYSSLMKSEQLGCRNSLPPLLDTIVE